MKEMGTAVLVSSIQHREKTRLVDSDHLPIYVRYFIIYIILKKTPLTNPFDFNVFNPNTALISLCIAAIGRSRGQMANGFS